MGEQRRVLFHSRSPMNSVMVRPLVRGLARDSRIDIDFFCGKPSHPDDDAATILAPLCDANGELPGKVVGGLRVKAIGYDLAVSPDALMPASRARRKAQTFHGVSFKGKAYSEKMREYSDIFVIGEYMRRRFVELGIFGSDDPALRCVGMPKTDGLADGSIDGAAVRERVGLDPARPTAIYAPTWRKESSLNVEGEAIIDALAAMGLSVLVKIHDHCRDPRTNRRDWSEWLDAREDDLVRRVRDADIVPYLVASDILVSDASSVANEFTLLDRPIVFMDVPDLMGVYRKTADLDTWGRKTGKVAQGAGELPTCVEESLARPEALSDIRRAAARDLFYHPGGATQAALGHLYDMLNISSPS